MKKVVFMIAAIGLITMNSAKAQIGNPLKDIKKQAEKTVKKPASSSSSSSSTQPQQKQETSEERQKRHAAEDAAKKAEKEKQDEEWAAHQKKWEAEQAEKKRYKAPGEGNEPSKEAIAADPRASVTKVEEGYTKSPAQIRATYEALDREKYFFPYYNPKLKRYYFLNDSKAELDFFENSAKTLDVFRSTARKESYFISGKISITGARDKATEFYHSINSAAFSIIDTIPAGNRTPWDCYDDCIGVMPIGIHVLYAGYALFAADPQGLKPFMRFCEARNAHFAIQLNNSSVSVGSSVGSDGRTLKTGGKLPVQWSHIVRICEETPTLDYLAKMETPLTVFKEAATFYRDQLAKYDAAKDIKNTRYYFHLFELAMYFWQESKYLVKDAPDYDALLVEYVRYANRYEEWARADLANHPPVEMPKTYSVDASLAAKALEVAKKQFPDFKVDKVVFLSDKWSESKQANYPYQVTQRYHTVAFLSNENGKWIMRQPWRFVQPSDSKGGWTTNYSYQAVSGDPRTPKPVNYKP